jgi:predicted secreted Zn-dependent protease
MGDVKVSIKVNAPRVSKFRVGGKTLAEAKKALDSRDEWGLYDSTQNQRSDARADKDGNVISVSLTLSPIIELPTWSGYSAATKEQKASWDDMVGKLEAHERKHHTIQVNCAKDLEKDIKSAKDLDAKTLKQMLSDNQDDCQKQQDSYDSRSGHGAKEGVVLDMDADP